VVERRGGDEAAIDERPARLEVRAHTVHCAGVVKNCS
jgi:hypothetical protein